MKSFIYLISATSILQFLSAHLYANFKGSSKPLYDYLSIVTGLGGFAVYGLFIWACFLTAWWIPIIAYAISFIVKILIPPIPIIEAIASFLFPLSFATSIVLLILQI